MADLSVIILTRNEEIHLQRCLDAIRGVAREVVVVDSFSTDATVEIARQGGATVVQHPFENYARQFQWALDTIPLAGAWVMRLDADEVVEPDLAGEIEARLAGLPAEVTGINLKRKVFFAGQWIRHGGWYPQILLRLWRRGGARIEDRWMDEHMVLAGGTAITFAGGFRDENLAGLTFFTDKHNRYATREAIDVIGQRRGLFPATRQLPSRQASVKRFLKENLYNGIPFPLNVLFYTLYRLVFRLGVLDGMNGIVYHVLQGFWYRFLVGAKIRELNRAIAGLSETDQIIAALERRTGLAIGRRG